MMRYINLHHITRGKQLNQTQYCSKWQ